MQTRKKYSGSDTCDLEFRKDILQACIEPTGLSPKAKEDQITHLYGVYTARAGPHWREQIARIPFLSRSAVISDPRKCEIMLEKLGSQKCRKIPLGERAELELDYVKGGTSLFEQECEVPPTQQNITIYIRAVIQSLTNLQKSIFSNKKIASLYPQAKVSYRLSQAIIKMNQLLKDSNDPDYLDDPSLNDIQKKYCSFTKSEETRIKKEIATFLRLEPTLRKAAIKATGSATAAKISALRQSLAILLQGYVYPVRYKNISYARPILSLVDLYMQWIEFFRRLEEIPYLLEKEALYLFEM